MADRQETYRSATEGSFSTGVPWMGCGYLQLICGWAVDRVLFYVGKSYFILDRVVMDYVSYMIKIVMFSSFQKHIVCIGLFCL